MTTLAPTPHRRGILILEDEPDLDEFDLDDPDPDTAEPPRERPDDGGVDDDDEPPIAHRPASIGATRALCGLLLATDAEEVPEGVEVERCVVCASLDRAERHG